MVIPQATGPNILVSDPRAIHQQGQNPNQPKTESLLRCDLAPESREALADANYGQKKSDPFLCKVPESVTFAGMGRNSKDLSNLLGLENQISSFLSSFVKGKERQNTRDFVRRPQNDSVGER